MKLSPNLLLSLFQKRFLRTILSPPPPTTANSSSFTVQFLVNSCGLPLESALTASQKLHLHENNIHKTQSVLHFLKSYHFDDTHIANLIKKSPQFLRCKVEDNLKPKFEFLVANGFSGNLLPQLILSYPDISGMSLDSNIKPSFELLKFYIGTSEKISVALKRCPWLLRASRKSTVQANIDLLIKEGLPHDRLAKLIISFPRSLLHNHDWMVYAVNTVKNLGLEPGNNLFGRALAVRLQMTDTTWKKKIEVLKSLGWSEKEIFGNFKGYPQILAYSVKKIRNNMDFLINTVQLELEIIFGHPCLLSFSVDKRIRPRYNVIHVLKSKNLIKGDKKIAPMLILTDKKFLENYVVKYADDVPGLLEVYMGTASTKKQSNVLDGRDVGSLVQYKGRVEDGSKMGKCGTICCSKKVGNCVNR